MPSREETKKVVEEITNSLKENKPDISNNSIKTYVSLLKNLFYNHHPKDAPFNINWFSDKQHEVLQIVKNKKLSSQQPTLSALIAVSKHNEQYKAWLLVAIKENRDSYLDQEKSDKEKKNWATFDEIKNTFEIFYNENKHLLKVENRNLLNNQEWNKLLDLIIFSVTSGYFIPPRRSLDWAEMKINKINTEEDNYIDFDTNEIVFTKYKMSNLYNAQRSKLPKKLKKILKRFIKLSGDNEYLLTKNNGSKFTSTDVGNSLNKILGRNISTSMLRHIFLTDFYKDIPHMAEMQQCAYDMGHSIDSALRYYVKK